MNQKITSSKSAMEMLPVETKQAIMSALGDVRSLQSAALTCSSLYHAFSGAKKLITTQVLLNEINPDVLPEAVAALESSHLKLRTRQHIQNFVSEHFQARKYPTQKWTWFKAHSINNLYSYVQYFAADFASKTLAKHPLSGDPHPNPTPPSRDEMARIERAFYRFEIYCNLFRDRKHPDLDIAGQRDLFFSNFSPWENEQLACIHDYLSQVVSPAFNDIAEHDVAWGGFLVPYHNDIDSVYIQHVLSLGLAHLYRVAMAKTYEARHEALYDPESDYPSANHWFLYKSLKEAIDGPNDVFLSDYPPDEQLSHVKSPFFQDADTGPADAWRWAHQDESWREFVYSRSQAALRECGYVMWDRARLDEWGILQKPWDYPDVSVPGYLLEMRRFEMRPSWRQRSEIYMAGGRGWWSWEDESKIVWSEGEVPWAHRYGRDGFRQVSSVGEARAVFGIAEASVMKFERSLAID